jgi:hypothetical protein
MRTQTKRVVAFLIGAILLLMLILPGVKSQEMPRLPAIAVELTKTPVPPPFPTATPVGKAYAPAVFEMDRTPTATAEPTVEATRTPVPSP